MRIIFRYKGSGEPPAEEIALIKAISGLRVIDESRRMLLTEADGHILDAHSHGLNNWVVSPETMYEIPEKKPRAVN